MPKDLPGFYFDPERNRYFPLSARPAGGRTANKFPKRETQGTTLRSQQSGRQIGSNLQRKATDCIEDSDSGASLVDIEEHVPSSSSQRVTFINANPWALNTRIGYQERTRATHKLHCANLASTSRSNCTRLPIFGKITTFCSTALNDGVQPPRRYIGDDRGWLYSCSTPTGLDREEMLWCPELNLHPDSQISSIHISGQRYVASCFGPVGRIAVNTQDDDDPTSVTTMITMAQAYDIRTSSLRGKTLVLGAHKRAVYIPDIRISSPAQIKHLRSQNSSDVFAVEQDKHLVYIGTRDGAITRFDMRIPVDKSSGQKMFLHSRFAGPGSDIARSPVLYLKLVKESQLLVSQMNGDLNLFDIRFPMRATPTITFKGHVNSISHNLGIAIDPSEDFLFAAGEDSRIRGWSLRTAEPLIPTERSVWIRNQSSSVSSSTSTSTSTATESDTSSSDLSGNPFLAQFPAAISTMQVTEEHDGSTCLWAGMNKTLYQYYLGQSCP